MLCARFVHGSDAFAPAHAASHLIDKEGADHVGVRRRLRRDIGKERHGRRRDGGIGQRLFHRLGGGLHQRAVERRGDGQQNAALDAPAFLVVLHHRHRPFDRAFMAGNHDLGGIIIVRDGADLPFRLGSFGKVFGFGDIGAEQRGHRALTHRHGALHRLPAQFQQPCGFAQRDRSGGAQCAIFAQRMPGHAAGDIGQLHAALLLQHAQHGHGQRHDRRLGVFGEHQLIRRAVFHEREQLLAERVVDFLEQFAGMGAGGGQVCAHADLLAALSGENECAHRSSCSLCNGSGGLGRGSSECKTGGIVRGVAPG